MGDAADRGNNQEAKPLKGEWQRDTKGRNDLSWCGKPLHYI